MRLDVGLVPPGRANVLRLAVEGSRAASGILVSTYAQDVDADSIDQEIISIGDDCCFRMGVGAADRYLIRGFSWRSDDTTARAGGIRNPWDLRDGTSSSAAKLFRLINTRDVAGINEWTAPQGAPVVGGISKTYTFKQDLTFFDHLGSGTRTGGVLTRIFGTEADGYDAPSAAGVTLSAHGDIAVPGAVGTSLAITRPKAQFCCRLTSVKGTGAKLKLLINRNKAVCLSFTVETRWKRRNLGGLVSVVLAKAVTQHLQPLESSHPCQYNP